MDNQLYILVPTWSPSKNWHYTPFNTREEYRDYITSLFKEPGLYNFDETSELFNTPARVFLFYEKRYGQGKGIYNEFTRGSKEYIRYWDTEKEKCRKGVIFHNDKGDTWYLPRFLYHWLNFLHIKFKIEKRFTFPEFRDVQYHMALYECVAELHQKNGVTLKRRQVASSYLQLARIFNKYIFEESYGAKIIASDKKYIEGSKGSWRYLDEYMEFNNRKTAWTRHNNPQKTGEWMQKIQVTEKRDEGKVDLVVGTRATIVAITTDKDPAAPVGGSCHRRGTKVLMSTGRFKEIQDIKKGESILGIDNKPKKVLLAFNGISDMYHIEQIRGMDYYTTGEHLLYLINRDAKVSPKNKERLTKTKDWDTLTTYRKRCYVGVKNKQELEFYNDYEVPTLDPYYLGLWIGDGYRSSASIIVNKTKDIEIIEYLQQLSIDTKTLLTINRKEKDRYIPEMYVAYFPISVDGKDTHFTEQFIKYNLYYNKHIPDQYLYGSIDVRRKVLAGIIDIDGYYSADDGDFQVTCKSDKLAQQYAFLCRSLGAYVRMDTQPSAEHEVMGKMIRYSETNRLSINFQDSSVIPTKICRKQGKNINIREKSIHTSPIRSTTNIGKEEYFGIKVEDSLYYLEDLTISHNSDDVFHEEGGIAPVADQTYGYMREAMMDGSVTTGHFSIAGSVGDLDQCGPIKKFMDDPISFDFYPVKTTLKDDTGREYQTGLFIPVFWGYVGFIDKYGNSLAKEAKEYVDQMYRDKKNGNEKTGTKALPPHDYQLLISQGPRTIDEAFATRTASIFPLRYTAAQLKRIEDKDYFTRYVDLKRDDNKNVIYIDIERPTNEYPAEMKKEDKRGCCIMHEQPRKDAPWMTYYASIDPVETGKTGTSDSYACLMIYRNTQEVHKRSGDEQILQVEHGKLVFMWWGRFDDIDDTNEYLSMGVELYNAWTICESNKDTWIQYMRYKKRQKYLATPKDMVMDKEIDDKQTTYREYGVYMTGKLWDRLLEYAVNYLGEKLGSVVKDDTKTEKIVYGVERIPFLSVIKEMMAYSEDINCDQVKAFAILIGFVKSQEAKRGGIQERYHITDKDREDQKKQWDAIKSYRSPFHNMGGATNSLRNKIRRDPFRNIH